MKFLKGLLKNTLALLLAWVALLVLATLSLAVIIGGLASSGGVSVEKDSFLVIDLSINLPDSPPVSDFATAIQRAIQEEEADVTYLREVLKSIERAGKDERIAGIFLTGGFSPRGMGTSYAALRELRAALAAFRGEGKPIYGYLTNAGQRDLYVMSVADEIFLNPFGLLELTGLGAEIMFYQGAFEKFGIGVQVARVGDYKSAGESYTRKDLSDENREQLVDLLSGVWEELKATIASGRGIETDRIQELADEDGIVGASRALEAGLVDRAAYFDEVLEFLIEAGRKDEENNTFVQVNLLSYIEDGKSALKRAKDPASQIAVVYAEGGIVPGEGGPGMIGGDALARQLRQLRQDDEVKAVVLRVNSPGGSAYASELIHREMGLLRAEKPLIVSQGGYAASGGYWISANSDFIFTEPTTITGSIGVIVMLLNFEGAADWMGFSFDTVTTARRATLGSPTRPQAEDELAIFQRYADEIYDAFLDLVANGRDLERERIRELAGGRVWLGSQAVDLNLADSLGGLNDAIELAIERAGVGADFRVVEYPTKKTLEDVIAEKFGGGRAHLPDGEVKRERSALDRLLAPAERELKILEQLRDPHGIYARMPFELSL